MSEIKGQLLGLVLTLVVFAAVGTVIVSAVTSDKETITQKNSENIASLEAI